MAEPDDPRMVSSVSRASQPRQLPPLASGGGARSSRPEDSRTSGLSPERDRHSIDGTGFIKTSPMAKAVTRRPKIAVESITPFLWYNDRAEEAARFYTSIFTGSRITNVHYSGDARPGTKATALLVTFELSGQTFMALNGGPHYKFTPAVSIFVSCKSQKEVDVLWEALSSGGKKGRCGWLEDRFGLSWQVIPTRLGELMGDEDEEKAARVVAAMLKMTKINVKALEKAYRGR